MEKRALKICIILSTALTINTFAWAGTATVSWDPNAEPDLAGYKAYYGTSSRNYSQSIDMGNVINYTVSGLAEGQTYYFTVTAYNSSGLESDYSNEVSKIVPVSPPSDTTPPIISGLSTSNLTSTGLTIAWNTDEPADTQIEYGTSTSYGFFSTLNSVLATNHSQSLSGLSSSTLYHFRLRSRDASGNLAISGDFTFTTQSAPPPADTTPPVQSSITAINISATGATIQWNTDEPANSQVEYGTTTSYGSWTTLISTLGTSHNHVLTGLTPQTLYYYVVRNRDAVGNLRVSPEKTFTTIAASDTLPPLISSVQSTNISSSSATITWVTDELSTSQVESGPTGSYGFSTAQDTSLTLNHSQTITGLQSGSLYHFRVESADVSGNLTYSTDQTFTTAPLEKTSSPTDLQDFEAIPLNNKIKLRWTNPNHPSLKGVRITFVTDLATGQFSSKPPDEILLGDFTAGSGESQIFLHENLNNGTTYHYTAYTYDEMGNFSGAVYAEATPRENEENLPGFGCGRTKDTSDRSGQTNGQVPLSLAMLALAFIFMKLRRRLTWEGLTYPAG